MTPEEELKSIKESLPKTEDGVTVIPGMKVWYSRFGGPESNITSSRVYKVSCDMWEEFGGGQPYFIREKKTPFFSTEELAQQWKLDKLQEAVEKYKKEISI